jgi:molecular chaperone HscB
MQAADLSSNFFVLFGLPVSFDIDAEALAQRYREMQPAVHPDKFANASDTERRLSVQMAARINEAFRTLKDPLARGRYLLALQGVEVDDTDTAFDSDFLMQQMVLREQLGEVRDSADPHGQLHEIAQDIDTRARALTAQMAQLLQKNR